MPTHLDASVSESQPPPISLLERLRPSITAILSAVVLILGFIMVFVLIVAGDRLRSDQAPFPLPTTTLQHE
ncbi:MAG TPA: hypothetical protein VJL83_05690 [Patescibacteria group bacterium]|nr:hypothetical protein [Patescibacteria group bacterium]